MYHKKIVFACYVIYTMVSCHTPFAMLLEEDASEDVPAVKRGLGSYFSNSYFDEIALAVCASVPSGGAGHIFPVRRKCGSLTPCSAICTSSEVRQQIKWSPTHKTYSCFESLHIYKNRPQLAPNPSSNTDVNRVGLLIYRYHSCQPTYCGPNYCCCKKGP